jgi:hypothetical protein
MPDPVAVASRATAARLRSQVGPQLSGVEEALASRGREPEEFFIDPISLGSLIVSIVSLAWDVYSDRKKKHAAAPANNEVAQEVRVRLDAADGSLPPNIDLIVHVAVEEVAKTDQA